MSALSPSRRARLAVAATLVALVAAPLAPALSSSASAAPTASTASTTASTTVTTKAAPDPRRAGAASGYTLSMLRATQPAPCTGLTENITTNPYTSRRNCFILIFQATGQEGAMTAKLYAEGATTPFATQAVTTRTAGGFQASLAPTDTWAPGAGKVRVEIEDTKGVIGTTTFFYNALVATLSTGAATTPGQPFAVTGSIVEKVGGTTTGRSAGVPATFKLQVTGPASSTPLYVSPTITAASDGTFTATVPASATAGVKGDSATQTLAVQVVDASYNDTGAPPPTTGTWAAKSAGTASHAVKIPATKLSITNSFVSSVGWVKPGETYPSAVTVRNDTTTAATPSVELSAPTGTSFLTASGPGTHTVAGPGFTWSPGVLDPGKSVTLVLTSRARTATQLPTIVWRDLSSAAVLKVAGQPDATSTSHGPKVIPASDIYNTARYGDRPFPIIPVQYSDRDFQPQHSGEGLAEKINSPDIEGSTFNLFQEMSLEQLYPNGTVPSSQIASAGFDYQPGFEFQKTVPGQTCTGTTLADLPTQTTGTPLYMQRITNGIYNLPGQTQFYGADSNGSAVVGSAAGVGALQAIDSGCGPTGKLVHDAAALADPDIDYSDFDTDKDGVVDFFMVVFAGCGGNGGSQIPMCTSAQSDAASYDNIWPHSSSLAGAYTDPKTGLPGFTTDDQLKDLEGRPLWYTDTTYTTKTTTDKGDALKVFVRVGPYNVNPETAIDNASVISHEYGHSLGLPDYYSTGSRSTYGDWNLMATDKSQNMDAYSRQELGWVVPEVLEPGTKKTVTDFKSSKVDTGKITWETPDGSPYTLTNGADGLVHNSEMYVAKLPGRRLLDPAAFDTGDKASKSHLWWSGSGNDFGCAPTGGRNLDLSIPGLAQLPAGTPVKLDFKSKWDIEWDFDYAFVLTTTDGGSTYTSHASENDYTTSKAGVPGNPNMSGCLNTYDNGLTGTSGSYSAGTQAVDRVAGNTPESVFLADSYDISDLAGKPNGALRFSYSTDPGLARPGWFIDDVKVTATVNGAEKVLYSTDFETTGGPSDDSVFNGGCNEDLSVASKCTKGWKYLAAGAASVQDHAYYLEMRDRSSFDFEGRGENDRDAIGFDAGLYLSYTDEAHGYGNVGTDDPPAQSPLDSVPTVGSATPTLNDASFNATTGARSTYTDAKATPHVDNYTDPSTTSGNWEFAYDCLKFKVDRIEGTDAALADNLNGDVTFDMGTGCGEFDYGIEPETPAANTAPTAVASATPTTATTGQTVTFSSAGSTDAEDPTTLDYSWDLDGNGTKDAAVANPTFAYTTAGTYVAKLTVTDPQGLKSSATVTITVTGTQAPNTAPTAAAAAMPSSLAVGQTTDLSSAGSTDAETPDGLTYSWSFGDGGSAVDATTKDAEATYTAAGTYDVVLTVTDPQGLSDTATTQVTVTDNQMPNTAPTAKAKATPSTVAAGADTTLSAAGSTDSESADSELRYSWDFGDGGTMADAATRDTTASYDVPGTYTATVTVTDPQGLSDTESVTVTVVPVAADTTKPTIRTKISPSPILTSQISTISASGSTDDVSASDELTYRWDRRNGGSTVDSTAPSLRLRYRNPGVYRVGLTVTDEAGNATTKTIAFRVYRYAGCGTQSVQRAGDFRVVKAKGALRQRVCAGTEPVESTPGRDSLVIHFRGTQVDVIHGKSRRGGTAAVIVDGKRIGTVSFKGTGGVKFRNVLSFKGFETGLHRLEVRRIGGSAYVEGFLIR